MSKIIVQQADIPHFANTYPEEWIDCDVLVINCTMECYYDVNRIVDHYKHKVKTVCIMDDSYAYQPDCETHVIPYHLWRVYNELINKKQSPLNSVYGGDKFLCLTGKPYTGIHRAQMMYWLKNAGLLSQATYSLHITDDVIDQTVEVMPECTREQVVQFARDYNRTADGVKFVRSEGSMHYSGIPYNVALFENSKFQLISETHYRQDHVPFISEKTYTAIANEMPFIIVGDRMTCDKLQNMNFETFHSYYDVLPDWERIHACIDKVGQWLSDMPNYSTAVTHNLNRFLSLGRRTQSQLENILNTEAEFICPTQDQMWQEHFGLLA